MNRKKILKRLAIIAIVGLIAGGGIFLYMFNMPHRDVAASTADYSLSTSEIVTEYIANKEAANQKYLAADGDSKILEITGKISKISENFNGQKVVLLKNPGDEAGVNATFDENSKTDVEGLLVGETITVKGVIRSGASYDEDLELYEHVVLEKSSLVR